MNSDTPVRPLNQRAWFLAAFAAVLLVFCLVTPLLVMLVRSFRGEDGFVGERWFVEVMQSQPFWLSVARSFGLASAALAIELPLGLWIALHTPRRGWGAGVSLVATALPLMIPAASAGLIWRVFGVEAGSPLGALNAGANPIAAWSLLVAMDVWRWTGLVALLVYASLSNVSERLLLAARVDGASGWSIFRHVQLPRLWRVLAIAALIRFADSFAAYGDVLTLSLGRPGEATTLLGLEIRRLSAPADLGRAAAAGLVHVAVMFAFARLAWMVFRREPERRAAR